MTFHCTIRDVDDILSEHGADLRLEDVDGERLARTENSVLGHATTRFNLLVSRRYLVSALAPFGVAGDGVRYMTAMIAARYACLRRGNPVPESLEDEYQEIVELLKDVNMGLGNIPGVATSGHALPSVSNYEVDKRFRHDSIRVVRQISNAPDTRLKQHRSSLFGPVGYVSE